MCGLSSPPTASTTSASNNTPVAIPTGPAVISSTLVIAGAGTQIGDVNLFTSITHTFNADLDITLLSPAGTVVTISSDNGSSFDNVFAGTLFDDDADPDGQVPFATNPNSVSDHPYVNLVPATPLTPEEALAAFIDEDPNGTWTLTISDDLGGDGGTLNSWSLDVTTITCGSVGGCTPGSCDDENPCTDDVCNTSSGQCVFTPDDTNECTDGDACTDDACDAGDCVSTPISCDDDDCCTIDSCDPDSGCVNEPNTAPPVITDQPSLGGDQACAYLWPPQHGYVDFDVADTGIAAEDGCGIASVEFGACDSSQPENDQADGNSVRDCVYEPGALHLRAERAGNCSPLGRVYTSAITVTNVCGISATSDPFSACVWHDRRETPPGAVVFSANPGSNQNDTRPGVNGTYGTDCGPGCGEACSDVPASSVDPTADNDGDGVPVGTDNCPDVYNPSQVNTDGIAEGDDCDANDGLVDSLRFKNPIAMRWAADGGVTQYNVYRGPFTQVSPLDFEAAACFGTTGNLSTTDATIPEATKGFFYLVSGVIGGTEGSVGFSTSGAERSLNAVCP